jgi:hypothetical protein
LLLRRTGQRAAEHALNEGAPLVHGRRKTGIGARKAFDGGDGLFAFNRCSTTPSYDAAFLRNSPAQLVGMEFLVKLPAIPVPFEPSGPQRKKSQRLDVLFGEPHTERAYRL